MFQFDESAVREARMAFESAQKIAEAQSPATTRVGERPTALPAGRPTGKSEFNARLLSARATASTAHASVVPEPQLISEPAQRTIGWWTVMAMLLAWFASLPLSVAYFNEPSDSPWWADHTLVTMPTVVSFPAMAWFLWKVAAPEPSVGRVVGTIVLAPIFLTVGVLSFLFTVGIGSFVFAWVLYRQTEVASTAKGTGAA